MKKNQKLIKILFFIILLFSTIQCSTPEDGIDNSTPINEMMANIPDWQVEAVPAKPDVPVSDSLFVSGTNGDESYTCSVLEKNLVSTIKEFISVGTNFGTVWPGAMIQGNSLKTGDLQPIIVNRAPITLVTDLPLSNVSVTIENPNSANVQQAISDFMIAAGEMPEGNKAGAGTMNFRVEEASSFEQSMLSMGISAGFRDPESQAGLDGSLQVSVDRSSRDHTVVAKFIQEMFTVRFADDLITSPADFFTPDVTAETLQSLENAGIMGASNIPIYIESVSYGRVLLFSMESNNVSSADELAAELNASMSDYAVGGGNAYVKDTAIFNESATQYFSAGGTDEAANAAVRNLNWNEFFVKSPATTAVPISFVARTVKGRQKVELFNSETYQQRDQCNLNEIIEPPAPTKYEITITWKDTQTTGICATCGRSANVFEKNPAKIFGTKTLLTVANGYKATYIIDENSDYQNLEINSTVTFPLLIGGGALNKYKSTTYEYPYINLRNGNNELKHIISNAGGSVTLIYNVRKVALN